MGIGWRAMSAEETAQTIRRPCAIAPAAYAVRHHDRVRETLESEFFAALVPRLIASAGGGRVLDLGCGDGLVARLAGPGLTEYTGVDFRSPTGPPPSRLVVHDLRDGLGHVGREPYDVYVGTFGVASHLAPGELARLLADVAAHARPGAVVAIEALGLHSLEWPRRWDSAPGRARTLSYRLHHDVRVHPWSPRELSRLYEDAGIRTVGALDRSVQAGPKTGETGYWPGLPPLREALNALMAGSAGRDAIDALSDPLPPLPAGFAAGAHHALAQRRARLVAAEQRPFGPHTARSVWGLEPRSGRGLGHGLTVVGRVA